MNYRASRPFRAVAPAMRRSLAVLGLLLCAAAEAATPAVLDVHVLSRDAKFVGSSVGGALVTVRDATTGEVLAQGRTEGETGDTDLIMREPRRRGASLVTPETARFDARLDLQRPTRVIVSAHGPLDYPDSAQTVTATGVLLPGAQLTGAGAWVLELPGLIVDVEQAEFAAAEGDGPSTLSVRAHVAMMCGCPISADGLWPAEDFRVEAILLLDGRELERVSMHHAGEDSKFAAKLTAPEPCTYEVHVQAVQPGTGNAGIARAQAAGR